MGMNYYCISIPCNLCGCSKNRRHIGKSSCGWKFIFKGYPFEGPTTYKEWINELCQSDYLIVDENEDVISLQDFIDEIHEGGRQDKMKGSANMACGGVLNEDEEKYLKNTQIDTDISYWLDEEGYGFTSNFFG